MARKLTDLSDEDLLAVCIWAEARGEPVDGQVAVGWVVKNRVDHPCWWGRDYKTVILHPNQFSWTMTSDREHDTVISMIGKIPVSFCHIAQLVISGEIIDPTNGATSYYSTTMKNPPPWAEKMELVKQIGRHRFYVAI